MQLYAKLIAMMLASNGMTNIPVSSSPKGNKYQPPPPSAELRYGLAQWNRAVEAKKKAKREARIANGRQPKAVRAVSVA